MEFLIRAALIVDSSSPHHLSKKDLLIKNGKISKIGKNIDFKGKIIEAKGLRVSRGWVDMRSHFNDPGLEYKEDLESGVNAAAAGGFTDVVLLPNNKPVTSSKNAISYFQKWNRTSPVTIHPTAAVTEGCKGEELTEMIDLHSAGAIAFTDGIEPIWHTDIMLKSLQYLQKFNGLLINTPEDKMLTAFGTMNEGVVSTTLGLKGMPALAEEVAVKRDLQLLEYAGGRIHFSMISSTGAVALVKEAKKKGLAVTADVGIHHLKYNETSLDTFDTNFKVNPPLRTENDRKALVKALKEGVIDTVVTDHRPHDEESKKLEFDLADFGVIGLQTYYSTLLSVFGDDCDEVVDQSGSKSHSILGLEMQPIAENSDASLTLYSPDISWEYTAESNQSKSDNSPLLGQTLKGAVIGIVNNNMLTLNSQ